MKHTDVPQGHSFTYLFKSPLFFKVTRDSLKLPTFGPTFGQMYKNFKLGLVSVVSSCFLRSFFMNMSVNTRYSHGQQVEPDRRTPYLLKIHVSANVAIRTNSAS